MSGNWPRDPRTDPLVWAAGILSILVGLVLGFAFIEEFL